MRESRRQRDRETETESGGAERKTRKVDVRLPGKGHSNSYGARPDHLIITMIKWIRTSRLSIKNSLWLELRVSGRQATFSSSFWQSVLN